MLDGYENDHSNSGGNAEEINSNHASRGDEESKVEILEENKDYKSEEEEQ